MKLMTATELDGKIARLIGADPQSFRPSRNVSQALELASMEPPKVAKCATGWILASKLARALVLSTLANHLGEIYAEEDVDWQA